MSKFYISKKNQFNIADQFKESFSESSNPTVGYLFIGNHIPYEDETDPYEIYDTVKDEKNVWDNMIGAKKITGTDLEFVIAKNNYQSGKYYNQYDDNVSLEILTTANTQQNTYGFYVVNNEDNVYKCLSNNNSSLSTVEPIGQGISSNGIITTTDSYIWKYMYHVPEGNKFATTVWIPVPTNINRLIYFTDVLNAVDGEIVTVAVENSGNNYFNASVNVNSFVVNQSILIYEATTNVATSLAVNMGISGIGIQTDTYITAIDEYNRYIYLSFPTVSSGGGEGNTIQTLTRSVVVGDGYGVVCNTFVSNGHVDYIKVDGFGKEYNYAKVLIYGTGEDASARAIISPRFGHGFNAAKELNSNTVMLSTNIESTSNISFNTTFRQYGIVINPHKYGDYNYSISFSNAESTISQTTDVTLLQITSGYNVNEFVYQGSITNPSFSGIINEKITELYKLKLTNVKGTISIGSVLKSNSVSSGISVQKIDYPAFEPYSGDIIFVKNIEAIERSEGQSENIKFIVKF